MRKKSILTTFLTHFGFGVERRRAFLIIFDLKYSSACIFSTLKLRQNAPNRFVVSTHFAEIIQKSKNDPLSKIGRGGKFYKYWKPEVKIKNGN